MMRRLVGILLYVLCSTSVGAAPPAIAANGVSNAASRIPSTLPGGSLARGARIVLTGIRFGSSPAVTIQTAKLAVPAQLIAADETRIEARIPANTPIGPAKLTVTAGKETSEPYNLIIVDSSPGIYSHNDRGWGPGIVHNLDAANRRQPNSGSRPARIGQSIALQSSGLGGASPSHAIIGSTPAKIQSIRRDVQPGIDEVIVAVPPGVPDGCYVPVRLRGVTISSNTVSISISARGSPCSPSTAFPMPHWKPGNSAVVLVARSVTKESGDSSTTTVDELLAAFFNLETPEALSSPFLYGLPPGGCLLATAPIPEAASQSALSLLLGKPGTGIEAGPAISVNNRRYQRRVPPVPGTPGLYRSTLSGRAAPRIADRPVPLLLDPGPIQVTSPGGPQAGDFAITIRAASPIEFTRLPSVTHPAREPLHIEWQNSDSGRLVLIAASAISGSSATTVCLCLERASNGAFTFPPDLLAHLPLSRQTPGQPPARIALISWPEKLDTPIRARGLVNGEAVSISIAQSAILLR